MRRSQRFVALAVLSAVGRSQVAQGADAPVKVQLAADRWCPYTCTPGGGREGLLVDIVRQALRGRVDDYSVASWSRVMSRQSSPPAPVLLVLGIGRSDSLMARYRLSRKPVLTSAACFYRPTSLNWRFASADSLRGLRVGITHGYHFEGSEVEACFRNVNHRLLNELSGPDASARHVDMLLGRSDLVLEDRLVMRWSLRQHAGASSLVTEADCIKEDDPGVYVSAPRTDPCAEAVMAEFDAGLDAMARAGQLTRLMRAYLGNERR